jgi:ribosomal protein S18 acetylase RimI-like enzyme
MEYRTLESEPLETIYECFIEAFSDYIVTMQLPIEKFCKTMKRNNVDLEYSIGLYDRSDLVGFILNGVGLWNNSPTVYDSGTGICKKYRGKKYSRRMIELLKQKLKSDFSQYLLEVIQTNTPAYTLYSTLGFKVIRELLCFSGEKENLNTEIRANYDLHFRKLSFLDWSMLETFWNSRPSWQNSIQAVERISDQLEKIGAYIGSNCVGYGIFDPQSGEIVQIAVRKNQRGRGVGAMLLQKISRETKGSKTLRIVNIDKNDRDTINFFKKNGFVNDITQYEMILSLNRE